MLTTVKQDIAFVGTGLHSGRPVRMIVRPAAAGGIRFRRTDVTDRDNVIPARYDLVDDTRLNTRLTNAAGVSVSTVEHLMAALAGTGVWNAVVDIDGPEVPIMDGSARRFVQKIVAAGLRQPARPDARDPRARSRSACSRTAPGPNSTPAAGAAHRLRDRLRGRGDRPPVAGARHGQRRLRARTQRLPHVLPPLRRRGDAGARPGARRLARQRDRRRRRRGAEPRGPAPPGRVRAPQDARRARRPRAGRRADARRLPRRARRPRRDQRAAAPAVRDRRRLGGGGARRRDAAQTLPGAGVVAADLLRAG